MKKFISLTAVIIAGVSLSAARVPEPGDVVETAGVFEGRIVEVGNFRRERVYRINRYCISPADLPPEQARALAGKRVRVRGVLKIVKGGYGPVKSPHDGRIYEPLREPDKIFITEPRFKMMD